jgi:plasmid maintenance system antidote protein VapI
MTLINRALQKWEMTHEEMARILMLDRSTVSKIASGRRGLDPFRASCLSALFRVVDSKPTDSTIFQRLTA